MSSSNSRAANTDVNRGPQILAVCGSLVGLATVTVLLRLWVRVRLIQQTGWDDFFALAAAMVMLAEMIVIVPEVHYGAGRHAEYIVPASNVVTGLHFNFVTQPLCLIALCFTKLSVGVLLLRLTPSKRHRLCIWGVMVFTVLSAIGNLFTVFFQCTPLAFIWDSSIPNGRCLPSANLKFAAFFNSSVTVLTDVVFALLPVPMLWTVQLNRRVKTAVVGVLSLGIFASVSAIVKMTYLSSYGSHGDFLWDSSNITIWTTVEICTAMIAASIPSLKPLFRVFLAGSTTERESYKGGYLRKDDTNPSAKSKDAIFELHTRRTRHMAVVSVGSPGDDGSEESILGHLDGIQKTTEVSVSVDNH